MGFFYKKKEQISSSFASVVQMFTLRRFPLIRTQLCHRAASHGTSSSGPVGIVDLILAEHQHMRDEYEYFKSVKETTLIDQRVQKWISYIALHGHKEEIAFYPRIESFLNDQKKGGRHLIEHGIKEHRELETELKKLAEQSATDWKQMRKTVDKLSEKMDESLIETTSRDCSSASPQG